MKKTIFVMIICSLLVTSQAMAFRASKLKGTLLRMNKVGIPVTRMITKGQGADSLSGKKGAPTNNTAAFPYLTADKVNRQLEMLIKGIEDVKGIATALAIIIDLCDSDRISVDVALTAVQVLKLRAVYMKIFVSNGNSDIGIMIKVLDDNADNLEKRASKRKVSAEVTGSTNVINCE